MRAHQVVALLAVLALTALAAPAQAGSCKAGTKCVDKKWLQKCLAKNIKVWDSKKVTWATLMNDDCFMLGNNDVDLVSTAKAGDRSCKKTDWVKKTGKISSFQVPKGSKTLTINLYAVDKHWGTGSWASAPKQSSCLRSNSQRCNLCSYTNITIPIASPEPEEECGLNWQSCCPNTKKYATKCMNRGFGCIGGDCIQCGIEWRPACPGGKCASSALAVANDGNCQKCGGVGRPPCARGKCTARHTIAIDNVCEPCGGTNRVCCAHDASWSRCLDRNDMCMQGICMRGSD